MEEKHMETDCVLYGATESDARGVFYSLQIDGQIIVINACMKLGNWRKRENNPVFQSYFKV